MSLTFAYEKILFTQGYSAVAGVDEVGRGSLAGPVVAAAVVFPEKHQPITDITDSKQLLPARRQLLAQSIRSQALAFGIGYASVSIINQHGITAATFLAMKLALQACLPVSLVLVDGCDRPLFPWLHPQAVRSIVKGDQQIYSIASASILAKVERDHFITTISPDYPDYAWHKNKGYGTLTHRQALTQFGPSPHHRLQFVKKFI